MRSIVPWDYKCTNHGHLQAYAVVHQRQGLDTRAPIFATLEDVFFILDAKHKYTHTDIELGSGGKRGKKKHKRHAFGHTKKKEKKKKRMNKMQ